MMFQLHRALIYIENMDPEYALDQSFTLKYALHCYVVELLYKPKHKQKL